MRPVVTAPLRFLGPAVLVLVSLMLVSPASAKREEDLSKPLLERALHKIDRLYLHPEVIDPAAMAREGLQSLERASPHLLVTETGPSELTLHAGGQSLALSLVTVSTLTDLQEKIEEAVDFLVAAEALEISAEDLHVQALQGVLRTIDRHSRLIVGGNLDEFNTRFKGTLVGIGARIGRRRGMLRVIEPFPGAPAGKAGLLPGDGISHIDGHPTTALSVEDAVERIRGPEGVPVVLTVEREGEPGPRVFVIVRAKVRVPSVKFERLDAGIGFIRIDHFSQKTSLEVSEALDSLEEEGPLAGVIIDVRQNTGGSMRHAARIVNAFVEEGVLIRTEGSDGQPVARLTDRIEAEPRRFRFDGPVAVLVDQRTASGSEIVAGGLKFMDRSITIGAQTFGKGTVQKVYALRKTGDKVSMKLTVARYLLPGDAFINRVGVTPDIATGPLWLDPDEPILPDNFREPDSFSGRSEGRGGLDSRKNPGGGRQPTAGGSNATPVLRLAYPRVSERWSAKDGKEKSPLPLEGDEDPQPSAREAAEEEASRAARTWPDLPGDAGDDRFDDMDLRLAHDILSAAGPKARRNELLGVAQGVVERWQEVQSGRLRKAMAERHLTWDGPTTGWLERSPRGDQLLAESWDNESPPLELSVELPEALSAGGSHEVQLRVTNTSERPLHQLRARMESSSRALADLDFLIGELAPGQTGTWTLPLDVPVGSPARVDTWRLYLLDVYGALGPPYRGTVITEAPAAPKLEVRVRSRGEPQADGTVLLSADIRVRNSGGGDAGEVQVYFGSPESDSVERLERWAGIDALPSKEEDKVTLRLRLRTPDRLPEVSVRLRARDKRSGASSTFGLKLPNSKSVTDTGWLRPPDIRMQRPGPSALRRSVATDVPYSVLGSVESEDGLETVELFLGRDKLFATPASREGASASTRIDVRAEAGLNEGPNRLRIRAKTLAGVETSQSFWVTGGSAGAR